MYIYLIIVITIIFFTEIAALSREKNEAWNEHDDFKYDRGSLT